MHAPSGNFCVILFPAFATSKLGCIGVCQTDPTLVKPVEKATFLISLHGIFAVVLARVVWTVGCASDGKQRSRRCLLNGNEWNSNEKKGYIKCSHTQLQNKPKKNQEIGVYNLASYRDLDRSRRCIEACDKHAQLRYKIANSKSYRIVLQKL